MNTLITLSFWGGLRAFRPTPRPKPGSNMAQSSSSRRSLAPVGTAGFELAG
jgi:hypothetical protein